MITLNVDFFSLDGEQVGTFGNNDTVSHVYFLTASYQSPFKAKSLNPTD